MKLVCSPTELSSSLQLVSRAVAGRPTHPVLANVLLTADAATGRLSLTGFDLNLGIQTSLPASVEVSGAITLPARLFGEIVTRLATDSPITMPGHSPAARIASRITPVRNRREREGMFSCCRLVETNPEGVEVRNGVVPNSVKNLWCEVIKAPNSVSQFL
jgi:hypothetical protein